MTEFKKITGIEDQPYYSFFHNGQEYFIWCWLSDGGPDVYSMCLAQPGNPKGDMYLPNNVMTESAYSGAVDKAGGVKGFMKSVFIPKVNEYLSAQGGSSDNAFPENAKDFEKFNWIIENSLHYINGKVEIVGF